MTDLAVPAQSTAQVRVPQAELLDFTAAVFAAHGVPAERARAAAAALCHGDITGAGSHGLVNLSRIYLPLLESGRARADAKPLVLTDLGATVLLDARGALGLWAAGEAMELAVRRASDYGIGMVSVRGATHFGCAGHHALRAVDHGMIGVVAANCGHQRIARPPRGRLPMLGTNPLSVAAPAGEHPPFLLDMSTTAVPTGKVRAAARAGESIPAGWLADDRGAPITDPTRFDAGEAHLSWLGAPGAGEYKGFGLGLMVEVLAALVPGAGLGPSPAAFAADRTPDDDIGYLMLAIAPAALRSPGQYRRDAGALFGSVLGCPPVDPGDTVSYPGCPEAANAAEAAEFGVPLTGAVHAELREIADRLGLTAPGVS
ncbi:Ldh family oxidoreductase [Alloactinosynnema sp. L-07]|uniref:Ldh family oxidoreductase n=1 Tax=Alloactinosynnema sp. L-07 TaxID=1653480 RepID=UPI0006B5B3A7|nr:Ldh family oxidoreductase [Alloactinosynnema sp. L-07]